MIKLKKTSYLLMGILAVFSLTACQSDQQTGGTQKINKHSSKSTSDYDGVYKGTLPCADCPGIETRLTLGQIKSFLYEQSYLGHKGKRYIYQGSYTIKDNILTIYADKRPINFLIGKDEFTLLGEDLKPSTGELAPYYRLKKQQPFNFKGYYETIPNGKDNYKQTLSITPKGKYYMVNFSASKINGQPNCHFSGKAWLENRGLELVAEASNGGSDKIHIKMSPSHNDNGLDVEVIPVAEEDTFSDNQTNLDAPKSTERYFHTIYYCRGGASLKGQYLKSNTK